MPRVLILYHYFYPDDVVSAQHLAELAEGLARRGWDVTAMPCNRGCRDETVIYRSEETWAGVAIRRVWRPRFRQSSAFGRIANAAWMITAWSFAALQFDREYDAVVIGTDPVFSALAAIPWRLLRPGIKIAHWCFDLHPEAAEAEGMIQSNSPVLRRFKAILKRAYACCDLLVDIGPCMARRLAWYQSPAAAACLTPWALAEPAAPLPVDPEERAAVAPEASLCLMYSGSFGRAHRFDRTLALARALRGESVRFVYSVRGNRVAQLRAAISPEDANIAFVDFAPMERLEQRLSAADVHVVSLEDAWTGTVVPSKFFGALAVGRPVLYEGRRDSAIAAWIVRHGVGWVLDEAGVASTAEAMLEIMRDPSALAGMRERCHRVYAEHFSRESVLDGWDAALRGLLPAAAAADESH